MDKKIGGIAAAMLAACIAILLWATLPGAQSDENNGSNAAYVKRFFNKDKVIDINVVLSEADYKEMLNNPRKEEYKQADVTIDGKSVTNVGFRVKGNSSLNMVASSDSDRYSFKLDFDQYIDGQSLEGLTKLNLNNSISDPSYMREYLSYSLLQEMEVPSPAFCYANVHVNGELVGLYLAVEGIEEPFLQRCYGNDYGTLYKPYGERGKGNDLVYTDDKIESYSGLQAVTKLKNGSNEALINMIKKLNAGADLEKCLNIDEILRYFAVNTVLVNMDSYQGQMTHNYYLYDDNGVFSLLPWDYNMSFGGFGVGGGSQNSTSLLIDQPVSGTTLEQRPLLGKLLEVEEYQEKYHQYIEEFINGPFALDKMSSEIERVANMIRPHLEKDPTKFYSMEQFEQAIAEGTSQPATDNLNMPLPSGPILAPGEPGADKANPAFNQNPPRFGEELPPFTPDRKIGRLPGGGDRMMQGNNTIGLVQFVRERISNVSRQLSGELPSVGNSTPTKAYNFARGPQGGPGQPPPENWDQNRPERNRFPGDFPPGREGMGRNSITQTNSTYLYLIGCLIILLLVTILIVFKKRNKYSI